MDVFMDLYGHYFLEKDIRSVRLMLNAAHNDLYSMLFSIDFLCFWVYVGLTDFISGIH